MLLDLFKLLILKLWPYIGKLFVFEGWWIRKEFMLHRFEMMILNVLNNFRLKN